MDQLRAFMPGPALALTLALTGCLESEPTVGDPAASDSSDSSGVGMTDTAAETDTTSETDTGDGYPSGQIGTEVGDTIADLVFYRGTGEALALSSYAGQEPPALIIFGTASW